jgi:hypothetical protein
MKNHTGSTIAARSEFNVNAPYPIIMRRLLRSLMALAMEGPMAGYNNKGRGKVPPYIQLRKYILISEAWRELSGNAVKVLVELQRRYKGDNNGRISMSVTEAAEYCGMARNTAHRALQELQELGFIKCHFKGAYSLKMPHASEWELTDKQVKPGCAPSRDFTKWKPPKKQKPVAIIDKHNLNSGNVISINDKPVSKIGSG